MKKVKEILCIVFGHKLHVLEDGFCRRCGWGRWTDEYSAIQKMYEGHY